MFVIVYAPHFVAAYDMQSGNIAPIIKYMKGWTLDKIVTYCEKKGWNIDCSY
jgi:hypothetical protein